MNPVHSAEPQPAAPFLSLDELMAAHGQLLGQLTEDQKLDGQPQKDVESLLLRGAATGELLDDRDRQARRAAQGILDYWSALLSRTTRAYRPTLLKKFNPTLRLDLAKEDCPYVGFDCYTTGQEHLYFGRAEQVEETLNKLAEKPLLLISGPSGCGKSSLVRAGLYPRLQRAAEAGDPSFGVPRLLVPGFDPLGALWALVPAVRQQDIRELVAVLRAVGQGQRQVLIIDQFEELFTLAAPAVIEQFVAVLTALIEPAGGFRIVLTMREEFEARLRSYDRFWQHCCRVTVLPMTVKEYGEVIALPAKQVGLRFEDGVVDALLSDFVGPTAAAVTQSAAPPDRAAAEAKFIDPTPVLPLLEFTLTRLYAERERNWLTRAAYEKVGRGRQALARHAEQVYASLPDEAAKALADKILLRLALPVRPDKVGAKVRLARGQLHFAEEPGKVDAVLRVLLAQRLLRQVPEVATPQPAAEAVANEVYIEVIHDALFSQWSRIQELLKKYSTEKVELNHLQLLLDDWKRLDKKGGLLDAAQLAEVLAQRDHVKQSPFADQIPVEIEQLIEVSEARQRKIRERKNRLWMVAIVGVSALTVTGVFLYHYIDRFQRSHKHNQALRETAAKLKRQRCELLYQKAGLAQSQDDSRSALIYLKECFRETADFNTTSGAQLLLTYALNEQFGQRPAGILQHPGEDLLAAVFGQDESQVLTVGTGGLVRLWERSADKTYRAVPLFPEVPEKLVAAEFSPDKKIAVLVTQKGAAQVWEVGSRRKVGGVIQGVKGAKLSPDGGYLLTIPMTDDSTAAAPQRSAELRALLAMDKPRTLREKSGKPTTLSIESAQFSPDNKYLLTTSLGDNAVYVWSVQTGLQDSKYGKHAYDVWSVAAARGLALSGSVDGTGRLWRFDGRAGSVSQELCKLDHQDTVYSVAFSPDGSRLLTASGDRTAKLWTVAPRDCESLGTLGKHQLGVRFGAFSPRGKYVVTAAGKEVRLWDGKLGTYLFDIPGHRDAVKFASFSPQEDALLSASKDGTARVWGLRRDRPASFQLKSNQQEFLAATFSPDGKQVVTASRDNTAVVWNPDSPPDQAVAATLKGHMDWVGWAEFSHDGKRIVTASKDKSAMIWDAATSERRTTLVYHAQWVNTATFSPDDQRVLTSSDDGSFCLWESATGKRLGCQLDNDQGINGAAFSSDGQWIITAGADYRARLWQPGEKSPRRVFQGHGAPVRSAYLNQDGTRGLTASRDGTARLWNVQTGTELSILVPDSVGGVYFASFSPDGKIAAVVTNEGTIGLWDAEHAAWLGRFFYNVPANTALFSPDGKRLATARRDGTWGLYQMPKIANPQDFLDKLAKIPCTLTSDDLIDCKATAENQGALR